MVADHCGQTMQRIIKQHSQRNNQPKVCVVKAKQQRNVHHRHKKEIVDFTKKRLHLPRPVLAFLQSTSQRQIRTTCF
jgi:hypothetical protein